MEAFEILGQFMSLSLSLSLSLPMSVYVFGGMAVLAWISCTNNAIVYLLPWYITIFHQLFGDFLIFVQPPLANLSQ